MACGRTVGSFPTGISFPASESGQQPLPEINLQRVLAPLRRNLREHVLLLAEVQRTAREQVVDLGHLVARLFRRWRAHLVAVGENTHAAQDAVPREYGIAFAEFLLRDVGDDASA